MKRKAEKDGCVLFFFCPQSSPSLSLMSWLFE